MQLKATILLTALTAGSAVARMHGHERRHAHHQARQQQDVEKRGVGDIVVVTMNGDVVSWTNTYDGGGQTPTPTPESTTAPSSEPTAAPKKDTPIKQAVKDVGDDISNALWSSKPDGNDFSRTGFGTNTYKKDGDTGAKAANAGDGDDSNPIYYKGNTGKPWGSNIIEVTESGAHKYRHVMKLESKNDETWSVVYWNKIGPDGLMTGWFGNEALRLTVKPDEAKYVAIDDNSQGGFAAAEGDTLPTDKSGGYSCTWGEFDFANTSNEGWSGFDVSAIQAMNAGQKVQGMRMCDADEKHCSSITKDLGKVDNAYTSDLADEDGIGGNINSDAPRLIVELGYDG